MKTSYVALTLFFTALILILFNFIYLWIWNNIIVPNFNAPTLTFWQLYGIIFFIRSAIVPVHYSSRRD